MPTMEETRLDAPAPEAESEEKGKAKKTKAAKKQKLRGKLPTKRTVNLATVDVKRINWWIAMPATLIILAACAVFAKFAVADRFIAVSEARAEVTRLQSELDAAYSLKESFGDLNDRYAHYTYSGMTEEELGRVDRVEVMELLRRDVLPRMEVDSWSVNGNVLTLSVSGRTLQEINEMMQMLLADEIVDYCTVSTAQMSQEKQPAAPRHENPEEPETPEQAAPEETVSAIVIVSLRKTEQEAGNG